MDSFSKANTIKFVESCFGCYGYEYGNEEIKFEGIEVKNVVFESCSFKSTDVIAKVFADSRFTKNLISITFQQNYYEAEISNIKKIFEKYEKKNGLKIIFYE